MDLRIKCYTNSKTKINATVRVKDSSNVEVNSMINLLTNT